MLRVLRILFDLPDTTAALVEAKTAHLIGLIRSDAHARPGVPVVPLALHRAGLPLGLASASRRQIIQVVLEAVGLDRVFGAVVAGDDGERGSPAPDGCVLAARRLGIPQDRCLVVEDSRNGVLAAKAAGMLVVAIPCPATSHEDFSAADFVLPSLKALPKVLEQRMEVTEQGQIGDGTG